MSRPPCQAFADESFHEAEVGGFYLVAAAVFNTEDQNYSRTELRGFHGHRREGKLHWNDMKPAKQLSAVKKLAELGAIHLVAVGTPVPKRKQERARAKCLARLVTELHSYEVEHLVLESRTKTLNTRDLTTINSARHTLPKGSTFQTEHALGSLEPLLWAADIVAGAVRMSFEGQPKYRDQLADYLYEFSLDTDC